MANAITLARFPLLIIIAVLLYLPSAGARLAAAGLLVAIIIMDSLDGIVARARHEESVLGSLLDIMADRAVELVLWVCYADLGLIPVAIPIIYIIRGTVVDGLRNIHVGEGTAPFKVMRTAVGRWLVVSPAMRTGYAISKLLSFSGLAVAHALAVYAAQGAVRAEAVETVRLVFLVSSWISVAFCLARGIPVVVEAVPALRGSRPSA